MLFCVDFVNTVLERRLVGVCLGGSGVCLPSSAAAALLSASCSAPSGQVLPSCLPPNGPPGQAGVRAARWPGEVESR